MRGLNLGVEVVVHARRLELDLRLAGQSLELHLRGAKLLDRVVGDIEGVEDLRLRDLVGAGLDHRDALGGAGDDQVEIGVVEQILLIGIDDEVAVDLADPDRADSVRDGCSRQLQRRRGTVDREDVIGVDVVNRQRHRDQLGLKAPALGEQRADGAVDHAGGECPLLTRATLALEE